MVFNAFAFVSGLSLFFQLSALPPVSCWWALLVVALLFFVIRILVVRGWIRPWSFPVAGDTRTVGSAFVALVFALVGFFYAWVYSDALLRQQLPDNLFNRDVVIQGRVVGAAEHDGRRLRFLFRLLQVRIPVTPEPIIEPDTALSDLQSLIRLNWYGEDSPVLRNGDYLQLVVKLRPPSGFLNPGGFDYEKWLFQHRIVATGYIRDSDKAKASWQHYRSLQSGARGFGFARARAWLTERIRAAASEHRQHGVILALAVGDRADIQPEQWQRFITTGTNHLLAISGLHITLVATAAGLLFKLLWLQSKRLRKVQRQTVMICAATIAAFVYSAMAGFAIPTQRALIMFVVLAVFMLARRHHRRITALAIALIAVVIWNPLSVLSAGFWMSFSAVAILYLVYSSAPRQGLQQKLLAVLRGHLLITLGLYPATVLLFQQASLVSPIANFVSVPLVGLIITPAVFICTLVSIVSVKSAAILLFPVDWLLSMMSAYLGFMADLPLAMVRTGQVAMSILFLIVVAVLLAIMPCKPRLRWLLLPLLLPLVFSRPLAPGIGSYSVTFLDVGQGSAVVVRTATHVLVYDTGAQFSASFNAADAVIIPFLQAQRIDRLDALVVSHSDNDHSGGVAELVENLKVDLMWHSQPLASFVDPVPAVDTRWCQSGHIWEWDQVRFEFLHPPPNFDASDNNLSCVLRITSASGERTLLTGDIEHEVEARLLSAAGRVDILMAPHHGSLTSSSVDFLTATQPKYVVYTVGFHNRFGFPKAEVVQRYHAVGAVQISTAGSGATSFVVGEESIRLRRYRADRQRIWNREAEDVSAMTATLE